ncbi:hypothetical protein JCM8097_001811 [Rhodosporidiobolus ruineniae]
MSAIRKPVIRPPGAGRVKAPRKQAEPVDSTLDKLKEAIQQIQQHNVSQLSFEEHYRYAYNLVLHKKGHLLYNAIAELISAHLEQETKAKIVPTFPHGVSAVASSTAGAQAGSSATATENVAQAAAGQLFLDTLKDVWADHTACMSKLRDVLKYLDKVWTNNAAVPPVWELGLALFFHHVILYSTKGKPAQPSSSRTPLTPAQRPTADPSTVAHHLISTLLSVIRIEREGEVVSRSSIQSAVEILTQLTDEGPVPVPVQASTGTGSGSPVISTAAANARNRTVMGEGPPGAKESPYKTAFEQAFLKQTREFYNRESARLLVECDCPSFMQKINRRLDEEATRAQSYLAPSTEPLLVSLLEFALIEQHLDAIIEHPSAGLSTLIHDSRIDDLKLMYTLFGRVGKGHAALQRGVHAWIVNIGKQVNDGLQLQQADEGDADPKGKGKAKEDAGVPAKKPEGPVNAKTKAALGWVQNVLDLKDKFDLLLAKAFASDKEFEKSINGAFSVFVNENRKSPEYISLFINENLSKGLKGKTESEVDEVLNKSVSLFRFLTEKDAFEKYYNIHLSKRLIGKRSVSDDAERSMLAKFKVEAGAAFTKSAEGMMKDVKMSEDTIGEYRRHQERAVVKAPFDMQPIICGSNFWPISSKEATCELPKVLKDGIKAFEAFYNQKHSGRKLTFRPEYGSVDVKVKFRARTHELNVSTHAMVVLALFEGLEDDEKLSYLDISKATNMVTGELKRTLQTLACAKYKVLTKHPKGRDIDDTDAFSFNSAFTCPLAKIKIATIAAKVETDAERRETEIKVDEARNTQCDACVVRVMKDRKALIHQDLVHEVIRQLAHRFQPTPQMIKKSIERLIEKEYLERDEDDRKKLKYVLDSLSNRNPARAFTNDFAPPFHPPAAYEAPPPPAHGGSAFLLGRVVGDEGSDRLEAWRTGVFREVDAGEEDNEDELDEPFDLDVHRGFSSAPTSSPPFSSPVVGPPVDAQDESFVALAALHDPSLFSSYVPPRTPSPSPPQLRRRAAAPLDIVDLDEPDSPTALEVDFTRGRRARWEHREERREPSAARSAISSVGITRKVLSTSMKAEPSVEVQDQATTKVSLAGSPPSSRALPSSPQSPRVSPSKHARARSTASDQLLRVQSTSPASPRFPPTSPLARPGGPSRRYSYHDPTLFSSDLPPESAPPLVRAQSHHHPPRQPHHSASVAALSKYAQKGRRASVPFNSFADVGQAPSRAQGVAHRASQSDLLNLASPFFTSFSLADHLPSFQHLHFHTAPSPSPRFATPPPRSSFPTASSATGQIAWSSIRALNVRFIPGGGGAGGTAAGSALSSLGVNHFALGLQDLAAGGSRAWDPRLRDGEEEEKAVVERGGYESWPVVSTQVGEPPRVEVVYEGGGRRAVEVAGMSAEEIMHAVLTPPV